MSNQTLTNVIFESIDNDLCHIINFVEEKTNSKIVHHDIVRSKEVSTPDHFKILHRHDDIEARYFLDGSGIFFVQINDIIQKFECKKNNLLIIPANVKHYFEPTTENYYKVLRLFSNSTEWKALI